MNLIILGACLSMAYGMPSYIAVPADQIAFLDLTALRARRLPRQAVPVLPEALYEDSYQPVPLPNYEQGTVALAPPPVPGGAPLRNQQIQEDDSSTNERLSKYAEKAPEFGEYVDFGAHTGDNGAFGWYADYPVNNNNSG